jgi:peptidoglycan/LPS O-acetylase OafA/YrhL
VWGVATRMLPLEMTVPFITLRGWPQIAGLLTVSAGVSALYLLPTVITFEATRRLAAPAAVRFIARNTPIIFLAHMPVFLALHPVLVAWQLGYAARVIVQLLVCLVGLAALSEAIHRLLERSALYSDLVRFRSPERLALRSDEASALRSGTGALGAGARAFQASVSASATRR